MSKMNPLKIDYDEAKDVLTINGMKYTGTLFRSWAADGLPVGSMFLIKQRTDGAMTVERVTDPQWCGNLN